MGATCQEHPAQWYAGAPGKALHPGEKFSVKLSARISSGWHMYSITQPSGGPATTVITIPTTQPFRLDGQINGPVPHTAYDANFEMNAETYEDGAEFVIPVAVASSTSAGEQKLAIDVRFQVCNDTTCIPATTEHLVVPLRIEGIKTVAAMVGKRIAQKGKFYCSPQRSAPRSVYCTGIRYKFLRVFDRVYEYTSALIAESAHAATTFSPAAPFNSVEPKMPFFGNFGSPETPSSGTKYVFAPCS